MRARSASVPLRAGAWIFRTSSRSQWNAKPRNKQDNRYEQPEKRAHHTESDTGHKRSGKRGTDRHHHAQIKRVERIYICGQAKQETRRAFQKCVCSGWACPATEQLFAECRKDGERCIMGDEPFEITRAGAQDSEQANTGSGCKYIKYNCRCDAQARNRGCRYEPARQADKRNTCKNSYGCCRDTGK